MPSRRRVGLSSARGDDGLRGDAEAVYAAAAAEGARAERAQLATALRQRGVEVVDAPPDEFAPPVADAYLSLKAAGRL